MSIDLFKFLFIENMVIETLLVEDRSSYNEYVLQNLVMEMIHVKLRKTMAGVALSLGLLLPVSGQTLATNELTNADVSTKATSIVGCADASFEVKPNRICMHSNNGVFANSFNQLGITYYFKGKSGNYAYYESAR
ncbi:LCI fold-containing protein [Bacillus safensis]|uniref:LCI fold-containing protein n=1 Tax=Bacillus TaxID=1386 RepID=UPI001D1866BA|nr:LCI fold-containing protein [Bacillus safensis]